MHLNNVTVAEVEANGRLLVNKAADYPSEIERGRNTPCSTAYHSGEL
jgi:hypothetical protein